MSTMIPQQIQQIAQSLSVSVMPTPQFTADPVTSTLNAMNMYAPSADHDDKAAIVQMMMATYGLSPMIGQAIIAAIPADGFMGIPYWGWAVAGGAVLLIVMKRRKRA